MPQRSRSSKSRSRSQTYIRNHNMKTLRSLLKKYGTLSRDARSEIYIWVRSMVDRLSRKELKDLIKKANAEFPSHKSKQHKFVKRVTDNKTTYGITETGRIYKITNYKTVSVAANKVPKRIVERLKKKKSSKSKKKASSSKSKKKTSSSKSKKKASSSKSKSSSSKLKKKTSSSKSKKKTSSSSSSRPKKKSKPVPKIAEELARIISPKKTPVAQIAKQAKSIAQKIRNAAKRPRVVEEIIDVEEPIIKPRPSGKFVEEEEEIVDNDGDEETEIDEGEYYDEDSDEETEIDEGDAADRQVAAEIARIVTPRQASPLAVKNKAVEIANKIKSAKAAEEEEVHVLKPVRRGKRAQAAPITQNPFEGIVSNDILNSFE